MSAKLVSNFNQTPVFYNKFLITKFELTQNIKKTV